MWAIALKNSFKVLILFFLINNNSFALGDKFSYGKIGIDVRGNNLCFSVNRFNIGNFFFGREKVDDRKLELIAIEVSGNSTGYIWGLSNTDHNLEDPVILNSKRCFLYGENLSGYTIRKGPKPLVTAKSYTVSIMSYDRERRRIIVFSSFFNLEVTGETIKVTKVY